MDKDCFVGGCLGWDVKYMSKFMFCLKSFSNMLNLGDESASVRCVLYLYSDLKLQLYQEIKNFKGLF